MTTLLRKTVTDSPPLKGWSKLIVIKLSEFDYGGAAAIATIMLGISFLTLLAINLIQAWSRRRFGYV